jgi:NRAMP (natural resistance-associated macrophage protein)-like metal ion transporter
MELPGQKSLKKYWRILGPGLITGAADDDPSGIATYSQTGAQYGFQLLWISLFSLPMMALVQEMCARIGMVTGRGLAENIRREYSQTALYICVALLIAANTFNIAADIGAMAKGVQLIVPTLDFALIVSVFVVGSVALQVFTTYKTYARYLKYLCLVLLSYVIAGFIVHIDWHDALAHTLIPSISFSKDQLFIICAILGTTISPYLFFWQSSEEVEEEIEQGKVTIEEREQASSTEIREMRIDVFSGMFVSNLVMFFIIAVCGATLFTHGITHIQTAADAAAALKPLAGEWATWLFALGIIGTGLLSVPVLAGASAYALAETFRWREGLYNKPREALGFYAIIVASMLVALILNFVGIDPIKALIYAAVGNGIVAPVMLFFIIRLCSSPEIMGERVNAKGVTLAAWLIMAIMTIAGVGALASFFI